jgi:tetraprenyl-beta-curcumene synthase
MPSATQTSSGQLPTRRAAPVRLGALARPAPRVPVGSQLELARAFAGVSLRYLAVVLPAARVELARWGSLAGTIPSPTLRASAEEALGKRGNIEGAALFATLVPAPHRAGTIRALVAFQTAYNYLDALSERDHPDPAANAEQLHQALLCALHPDGAHEDYYAHSADCEDGGYLVAILDACRDALAGLPSFAALAPSAREAAARIMDFQTLNLDERHGGQAALSSWAAARTPPRSGLHWCEMAAACGSSLAVHALIAEAAAPQRYGLDARAVEPAYFPWAGALHSLLDSLVDRAEDREHGRGCLLDHYGSNAAAAVHLASLAERAARATDGLESAPRHRAILIAMCSYYLSAPQCDTAESRAIHDALTSALGAPLKVAVAMFRARRIAGTILGHKYC